MVNMNQEKRTRRISTCAPDHECTTEEINELLEEIHAIDEDTEIVRYDLPSVKEMKEIIEKAENYTGQWYHSNVVLLGNKENLEKEELKNKISQLGEENGIALAWRYPDKDINGIMKQVFENN